MLLKYCPLINNLQCFQKGPMQKIFYPVIILLSFRLSAGQTTTKPEKEKLYSPKVTTLSYKLGDRIIQLKTFQYGTVRDVVYINLHDDEITAVNGAKKVLEKKGGVLIKIENYRSRNIKFRLDGKYFTIDPNRMFSRQGIAQSLIVFGRTSPKAIDEIEKFANRVLQLIPPKILWIIALHNNTNGQYSINSYLRGGAREKDAKALNVNRELDADDFFLTTDSILFNHLASEKYNTILQDNEKAKKDGSLSIYCGERNIHYVNCETEHGRQPEYDEMIVTAVKLVEEKKSTPNVYINNPDMILYNYRILSAGGHIPPKNNTEILFGEKKVGLIRSVMTDSSKTITGKFEMNKEFSLYSNMDLFLFLSAVNPPRLEVRIDPTRKKEWLNPQTAIISISSKTIN
jgi:hypothetical protein